MHQIREARNHGFDFPYAPARVHCKVFEDNSGALEMAIAPKIRPRTKYINCKYHHFRAHVGKTISIHKIDSDKQLADGLTKPLEDVSFIRFRDAVMGRLIPDSTASAERESERILRSYGKSRHHQPDKKALKAVSTNIRKGDIPPDPGDRERATHARGQATKTS
jgi:hypothetical protein